MHDIQRVLVLDNGVTVLSKLKIELNSLNFIHFPGIGCWL